MSELIISKEVKGLLKTNHVLDPLPQAEMTKTLKKFIRFVLRQNINVTVANPENP